MAKNKYTIILFHHGGDLYGSDRIFLSIVKILSRKFRIVVFLGGGGPLVEKLNRYTKNIEVVNLGLLKRKSNPIKIAINFFLSLFYVTRAIFSHRPKLIVTNTLITVTPAIVARLLGIKHLWFVHEHPESSFEQGIFRLLLKFLATAVVAPSPSVKSWAGAKAVELPFVEMLDKPKKLDILEVSRKLNAKEGETVLGCVGMLHPKKGQKYFIQIAKNMLEERSSLRFVFVGGQVKGYESYRESLLDEAKEFRNSFLFTGFTRKPLEWMHLFDILVIPSQYPDPFPLVAQEAMYLSKPIVATPVGGLKKLLEAGENGIFIPTNDAKKASLLLLGLIGKKNKLRQMSKKSGILYERKFSFQKFSQEVEKIVTPLLS